MAYFFKHFLLYIFSKSEKSDQLCVKIVFSDIGESFNFCPVLLYLQIDYWFIMEVILKAYNVKEHLGKHFISDESLSFIRLNSLLGVDVVLIVVIQESNVLQLINDAFWLKFITYTVMGRISIFCIHRFERLYNLKIITYIKDYNLQYLCTYGK